MWTRQYPQGALVAEQQSGRRAEVGRGGQRWADSKQGESDLQKSRGCDSDPRAPNWGWSIREGMPCTVACSGCCDKHRLAARTRYLFHTALGEESPRPGLWQAGPSEASLLGWQTATFSCVLTCSSLCPCLCPHLLSS